MKTEVAKDICARLRRLNPPSAEEWKLVRDAADEIERLEAVVHRMTTPRHPAAPHSLLRRKDH